jgi:hypothetical protein
VSRIPLVEPEPVGSTGMGLDKLRQQFEYRQLTAKQQKFVEEYVTNGCNAEAACAAAYDTSTNAKTLSYQILDHPAVLFCVSLYFGNSPAEAFSNLLWKMIVRRKINRVNLNALLLYADVRQLRTRQRQPNASDVFEQALQRKRRARKGKAKADPIADEPEDYLDDFENENAR